MPLLIKILRRVSGLTRHSKTWSWRGLETMAPPVPSLSGPLTDTHNRIHDYLRISLTERCNLRCRYCMPAEGVQLSPHDALLTSAELERLVRVFANLGVHKIRLTGGEPTVRTELPALVTRLKAIPGLRTIALTTNGLLLTRLLPALHRAGVDALNISLDSLRAERYERMSRRSGRGLARVLAGIDLALQLGYAPVKINCVLMKGFNDDEIGDFVALTRDRNIEVRFIEFMPFSGNAWETNQLVAWRTALKAAAAAVPAPGLQPLPGSPHDTAKLWAVPGWTGAVGFISSMTEHFCAGCNRLRLMADGSLKVCLFGASEISLRDALRAGACDNDIAALIRAALRNKKPSHAGAAVVAATMAVTAVPWQLRQQRAYCNDARLSHLDDQGRARMVDVGAKAVTRRMAVAECSVRVAAPVIQLLRAAGLPKGDALTVAEIAGVMGAKRTADLLPLCHPLPLDCVRVSVHLPTDSIGALRVRCEVCVRARTGAEMEALTGAAVAALALYDMCKSADKNIVISDLRLLHKSGGRSDSSLRSSSPPTSTTATSTSDSYTETYAPTGFPHL